MSFYQGVQHCLYNTKRFNVHLAQPWLQVSSSSMINEHVCQQSAEDLLNLIVVVHHIWANNINNP